MTLSGSTAHDPSAKQYYRYLPPERPTQTTAAMSNEVLLVLDARGRIQYCGNKNSFLHNESDLTGRPLDALIPGLTLREKTPGYNVAFVRFSFADNVWQRHLAVAPDGCAMAVDVHLRTVSLERGYCLIGLVRPPAQATRPTNAQLNVQPGEVEVANDTWRINAILTPTPNRKQRNLG